ncbi:MAG TPA: MFS transporter, partial [Terriglobia bacterium]|nr:MFS transporter [Terriglobia bacterium]
MGFPDSSSVQCSALIGSRLKLNLYLMCGLTDFASFAMVFAVSRGLAEGRVAPWYLGLAGAGLSFSAAVGSILGGWLASRFDGRIVFVSGAGSVVLSIAACWFGDFRHAWLLPGYWLLGIGLGLLYPPLIGWLNQGENPHSNHRVVSRTLILFCVAWNVGMMCGQLTAGALFPFGQRWVYGAALFGALPNLVLAFVVAFQVRPFAPVSPHRTHHENKALERAVAFKRLSWIANLGGMFGASMIIHLLPDLAVVIGVHPRDHGKLLASWRGVIVGTYLLMHYTAHWHYRFSTALASQLLAACGLLVIAQSESTVSLLAGLTLLGQLVGYNYFSGLFYSTAGSSDERRALAAGIHEATLAGGMAIGTMVGGIFGSLGGFRMPYIVAATVMFTLTVVQSAAWWKWVRSLG